MMALELFRVAMVGKRNKVSCRPTFLKTTRSSNTNRVEFLIDWAKELEDFSVSIQ